METPAAERKPDWRLIAVFYCVCLSWVSLVALALHLAGTDLTFKGPPVAQFVVAFLYMPAPLASALLAERVGRRPLLVRNTFRGFERNAARLAVVYAVLVPAIFLAMAGLTFLLGNLVHVPGVGTLATTQAQFELNAGAVFESALASTGGSAAADASSRLPPLAALYPLAIVGALLAGLSVNGLFAFGEEYGWRGFLMDELRPLGPVKANLLTGILWGLFHAPLILMGFNYAPDDVPGVAMMAVLCTPLSFLLWRARQVTGSLLAPAILHGAFNGFAGVFLLLVAGRRSLLAAPAGLAGAAAVAVVASAFWVATRNRQNQP